MKEKKEITWIAVTDSREAHLFSKTSEQSLPILEHSLSADPVRTNPDTRKSLGRAFESASSARHIIEPHTDERTQERQGFMTEVANYLKTALTKKMYDKLILVAPPKLLGLLRKELNKAVHDVVVLEVDKDLIDLSPQQLQESLKELVDL